ATADGEFAVGRDGDGNYCVRMALEGVQHLAGIGVPQHQRGWREATFGDAGRQEALAVRQESNVEPEGLGRNWRAEVSNHLAGGHIPQPDTAVTDGTVREQSLAVWRERQASNPAAEPGKFADHAVTPLRA